MLSIADADLAFHFILGAVIAFAVIMLFLWGGTNLFMFLSRPREYWLWKKGGGDPFFDTLDSPLNNDPPEVRFQELFRERARQEWEASFGPLPMPKSTPLPDTTKGIDDVDII
jgi:hypothetical protein